jgi:hypothetical protein
MKCRNKNTKNLEIREIMNAQYNIIDVVEERRLRLFGYFKRMGSKRI